MSDVRLKSASDNFADAHALHVVDTSRAKDGVWLVKVPKYLAELWHNAGPDGVVGKVVIASSSTASQNVNKGPGSQVTLVTDSELLKQVGESGNLIPKEHQFLIQTSSSGASSGATRPGQSTSSCVNQKRPGAISGQELIILCEDDLTCSQTSSSTGSTYIDPIFSKLVSSPFSNKPNARYSRRLSLFGRVNSRAECRPPPNTRYMMLKAQQLKAKNRPRHEIHLLYEPVRNYKPVSNHVNNIEYELKKKAEGKNLRRDKEDVLQDLFKAFERHQYYSIKDLVVLTKQPLAYLTEILREIAVFNNHIPHKNMWELKPEYRHYTQAETKRQPNTERTT
uniref:General transcription factor IIF subunit 2 n=1 Tax=Trichobilharzia regenti TaxID=157069 RepID=A0AA85KNH9_TRIRE|nr:unnamed protein product [Trichobilharzia regenti]